MTHKELRRDTEISAGTPDSASLATERLLEVLNSHGLVSVRQRLKLFLGHKLAEEVAIEARLAEIPDMDEPLLYELKRVMGYAAAVGMGLREKRTTDPAAIEEAKADILEQIPGDLVPTADRISSLMISRGMEFHEVEWGQETPKAENWITEFKALFPGESYEP